MKRGREEGDAGPSYKRGSGERDGERRAEKLTTHDALSYLREVKTRFTGNRKVYESFLEIMKQFKAQHIDTSGVIEKVKELFAGHPELILGFNTFLPKGYEIRMEDVHPQRFAPRPAPAAPPPEREVQQPKPQVEFDQAISYVNKIKTRFANDERVYKAFLEILNMYRKGMKNIASVYEEVALLFRSHDDLLREFTYFLPDNGPPPAPGGRRPGGKKSAGPGGYGPGGAYPPSGPGAARHQRKPPPALRRDDPRVQRELAFFDKVRLRLPGKEAYEDFLKCLNLFAEDVLTKGELVSLVGDIIGRHPDLLAGFNEFLMRCELGADDPYARGASRGDRGRSSNVMEKYIRMSISELDVSSWERCTPSYVQLPANYPRLKAAGRDCLGAAVFNDDWVSVTSGSEDYSFKHYRKNQYEEALFRAEDDHFELDMVIDQGASAAGALAPLAAELESLDEEARAAWRLPAGALSAFQARAVARMYGERGAQVLALLHDAPGATLPVVLARLLQKADEWRRAKEELLPVWGAIFRDNYHKSLDHRSFYFKQAEKKNLNAKAMLLELREAADRLRGARAAELPGAPPLPAPALAWEAGDAAAQRDAQLVVFLGLAAQLAPDHAERARAVFCAAVERFYALPSGREADAARRAAHPAQGGGRAPGAAAGAGGGGPAARARGRRRGRGRGGRGGPCARGEERAAAEAEEGASEERASEEEEGEAKEEADTGTEAESSEEDEAGAGDAPAHSPAEEEDESRYLACRPLVPLVAGGMRVRAPEGAPAQREVLLAGEALYVLFRLHALLYERLRVARAAARARAGEEAGAEGGAAEGEEAERRHGRFLGLVADLVEGRLEPGAYEDATRQLLGTGAYQLFTLDKLVAKLVKQLQAAASDDASARLLDLWRYEAARRAPRAHDGVYWANARVAAGDEPLYRLERDEGAALAGLRGADPSVRDEEGPARARAAGAPRAGCGRPAVRVCASLLEAERADAPPPAPEAAFADYVAAYVGGAAVAAPPTTEPGAAPAPGAARVCLLRTLRGRQASTSGAAPAEAARAARNGLECKLCWAGGRVRKVAYVLGTEDWFVRPGRRARPSEERLLRRRERFRDWVQEVLLHDPRLLAAER